MVGTALPKCAKCLLPNVYAFDMSSRSTVEMQGRGFLMSLAILAIFGVRIG